MTYRTFEEWAELNVPPRPAPPPPLPPVEDRLTRWKREGEEAVAREAEARAKLKANEQRDIQQQRAFEIRLAQANNNNVVDTELLNAIATALDTLAQRIEALEKQAGAKRVSAMPLPGRFPWRHPTLPGVRISQPVETRR
jgi:hypothetical protein